jgi:hypothetical protein
MTLAQKAAIGLGGLGVLAAGTLLWMRFGSAVYFDTLAAAFIGCFF